MWDSTQRGIDNLYKTFSSYKVKNFEEMGCFDYGPTPEEAETLSNGLKNIPDETVKSMEFFGFGWDSWGTKNEVGYLIPRIMQYFAGDVVRLEDIRLFSLFKYKLVGFFSCSSSEWTHEEKNSLSDFIRAIMEERLSIDTDVGLLIECGLTLSYDLVALISSLKINNSLYKKQVVSLLDYFDYVPYSDSQPVGYQFDDSEKIKELLDFLIQRLTKDEVVEIILSKLPS